MIALAFAGLALLFAFTVQKRALAQALFFAAGAILGRWL